MISGKNYNRIVLCLFAGFFFLILGLTIQVWYNNRQINKSIDAYNQINVLTNVILNDKLVLSSDGKLTELTEKQKYIGRIDTAGVGERINQIREATKELDETKRYILDANTITYLIQILCFFLIGLQLFISNKNERKTKKIEKKMEKLRSKMSSQIDNFNIRFQNDIFSSKIINSTEVVTFYSNQLLNLKNESEKEVKSCYSISKRLQELIDLGKNYKDQKMEITPLAKQHSIELLYEVDKVFKNRGYDKKTGYYKDIYNRLLLAIKFIKELPC